jgi:catechol 2,3-dioxygenase-like lactoylglutathione lyase family enzyme
MATASSRLDRVTIGSVVIRCYEFERTSAFWKDALQYRVIHADPNGGFVILADPHGRGPNVSVDQAPAKRTGKRGWIHLDLYTTKQRTEVERLVRLGARRYPWRYGPNADYVVLEDPDGNLFCIVAVPDEPASDSGSDDEPAPVSGWSEAKDTDVRAAAHSRYR